MDILFLCTDEWLGREKRGFADAFESAGHRVVTVPDGIRHDVPLDELLSRLPGRPGLIFLPDSPNQHLPWDLASTDIPTANLEIDLVIGLKKRLATSMLFDIPCLGLAGFEDVFRVAGHPAPLNLPVAFEARAFAGEAGERRHEVAWVGVIDGPLYERRRRLLPQLAAAFEMNDWRRSYSREEMAEVLKRAKVVVNIQRDDAPLSTSLRCLESLAAGALLVTRGPSDLEKMGFHEGTHYATYYDERDLVPLVRKYLLDEPLRLRIATAGRALAFAEHTYDARVARLMQRVAELGDDRPAPARRWSIARRHRLYCYYFAQMSEVESALHHLYALRSSPKQLAAALPRVAIAVSRRLQRSVRELLPSSDATVP